MTVRKYCKDCGHNMKDSRINPLCRASRTLDLVTGVDDYTKAREMKKPNRACGEDAKLFIPKLLNSIGQEYVSIDSDTNAVDKIIAIIEELKVCNV